MTPVRVGPNRWVVEAMDTVFSLVVPNLGTAPGVPSVVAAIAADWRRTEARLSVFRADSEISRWRAGRLPEARLSDETRAVMRACDALSGLTGGLFSARRGSGYDPTGYVKGWALARAARALDGAGLTSYCIGGGGDIIARGLGPHGVPWRVGVAHPYRAHEFATIVTAIPGDDRPLAVATSGTAERGAHIVNPLDGWRPTRSSVTVVGHDIALVDAVATAALAAGRSGGDASAHLVASLGLEAVGFGEDGRVWWTPGMPDWALLPAGQG